MNMRSRRLRWKTMMIVGATAWRRLPKSKKTWVLKTFEDVGHDEHNCWDEYLVLRFK